MHGHADSPPGPSRSSAGLDDRRKRLLFRAWRRGTRELDILIGSFADMRLPTMTDTEIETFERLLDVPDPELYAWLTGAEPVPAAYDSALFGALQRSRQSGAPAVR